MGTELNSQATIDEDARRRFEADWRAGQPLPLEHYLPAADHSLFRATLEELVQIEIEFLWKAATRTADDTLSPTPPLVEVYLARFPALDRPEVVQRLVRQEFRVRHLAGDHLDSSEYRRRFPGIAVVDPEAGTLPTRSDAPESVPDIPGYEILGLLGRGGMGAVFKARQVSLNRLVAVKKILTGAGASAEYLARFRTEAEALARLQHPHVVQIHEVGQHEGRPYFSLEFCPGGSLAEKLAGQPQPPAQAARTAETLARAVHAVHQQGIVHRDLKPHNVLLTADGTPKISDFGLAKYLEGADDQTQTGAILGTPSYMAPEQAEGKSGDAGPAVDVWALGAILYELLTGRPPFRGATSLDTLEQVRSVEPVPPSRLQAGVPRDLETVCLKCLHKDARRRYAGALDLAEDLARFLAGEPILARPVGSVERWWRWCRRKPLVAGLTAAVALLLVTVAVGAIVAALRFAQLADEAEIGRRLAEDERLRAVALEKSARASQAEAQAAEARAVATLIDMAVTHGLTVAERGEPAQALMWFAHAARLARDDPARRRSNGIRVRAWERLVPPPVRALPHEAALTHLAFHPDGLHLLTVTRDRRCTVWDLRKETPLDGELGRLDAPCAAWSPDGRFLALAVPGGVEVRRFPSGDIQDLLSHPGGIEALAFSPDGRFVAAAGRSVRAWDARTFRPVTPVLAHPRAVRAVAFSERGDRLATACADGKARVFAVPADEGKAEPLFPPVPHRADKPGYGARPLAPVFILGGKQFLTVTADDKVGWWRAEDGRELRRTPFTSPGSSPLLLRIEAAAGGRRVAVGGFSGAWVWDVEKLRTTGAFLPHANYVTAMVFHPDGKTLLTASEDRRGRLWAVEGGQPVAAPLPHQAGLTLAAYSADGRLLATAQSDGLVRVWRLPPGNPDDQRVVLTGLPSMARLSPDGRHALPTGGGWYNGQLSATRVYAAATGKPAGPPLEVGGLLTDAALSPTGRQAVTVCSLVTGAERYATELTPEGRAGRLQFWDWTTGKALSAPVPMPSEPRGVAYRPDGKRVAVVCAGGQVLLIDSASARVTGRLRVPKVTPAENTWPGVEFTPDGRLLLAWGCNHLAAVWDVSGESPEGPPRCILEHGNLCYSAVLSPDRRRLLTASVDGTARVWDLATGKPLAKPLPHPEWVFTALFHPDGETVLTACRDGMARLWHWRTGRLLCPPLRHHDSISAAEFSPDGRWVVTGSRDKTARVWEVKTGKPVTPPFPFPGNVWVTRVTPDGERMVLAGWAAELGIRHLGDLRRGDEMVPDGLCLLGEVLSGQRVHEGDVENLTTQGWLERWRQFRGRHPDPWEPGSVGKVAGP